MEIRETKTKMANKNAKKPCHFNNIKSFNQFTGRFMSNYISGFGLVLFHIKFLTEKSVAYFQARIKVKKKAFQINISLDIFPNYLYLKHKKNHPNN